MSEEQQFSLAIFMRSTDRCGEHLKLISVESDVNYVNKFFYQFLISEEVSDYIKNEMINNDVYFEPEMLRQTLNFNDMGNDSFIDDEYHEEILDISMQPLSAVSMHIESVPNVIVDDEV
tara:strand:- start:24019 stop:24375 length:357 start_codon:yes stop_codon:yes gene_type:complete